MKKILLCFAFLSILILTGCNKEYKEVVTTCTLKNNNALNNYKLESTYKIHSKNDEVFKAVTEEVVTSSSTTILDYFESNLKETYKKANDTYGGYTYDVSKSGNKVTSKTTINYDEMDLDQYVKDNTVIKQYLNKNGKLTLEGMKKIYTSLGAECE